MELWIIWHERRDDMEAWRRGVIRPPDRPSTTRYLAEIASVVLITAGIVGELWIGIRITSINGVLRSKNAELRDKSDHLLELVRQDTSHANERAAEALLGQETLKHENLILEKSLAELQARIQWRHIPSQKLAKLISLLSTGPKGSFIIECVVEGEDSCTFAHEIERALHEAQWSGVGVRVGIGNAGSFGQGFLFRDPTHVPPFAVHLYQAFHAVGIELPAYPSAVIPEGQVVLIIGRKPEAKLQQRRISPK